MVVLSGKNLGERHREFNYKVAEVIAEKKNFNDIKIEEETSDVDKLYKIDVASEYKDVDYIVDILKSGDSLYISKVLKRQWLYQEEYSHIINPENLHANIFPFMSIKMKKKMLTTISMYIQSYDRAADFYMYCKKNQIPNIAFKFLISSSEEFKLNVLKNENWFELYPYIETNLQNFVGNSFVLATVCIEMCNENNRSNIIHNLRYLYAIDNEKYLEFLEKYEIVSVGKPNHLKRLGIRISQDIMLKHKNRVLENPILYVNKLNKGMLAKYSSTCEAKKYLSSLIPHCVKEFWEMRFYIAYDYILNVIPGNEMFEYMKELFATNYPKEPFENTFDFYRLKYYNMMSINQRELWALRNIDDQKEILGVGNDYIWYKFVNIDKALVEIKKLIMITPDHNKRASLINILVEATRDQKDLKKVLDYYYHRHINENENHKKTFIDMVMSTHNVFELNIECWEALNKLFYSLDIYTVGRFGDPFYRSVAVVCHILHNIDLPEALLHFIDLDVNYHYFRSPLAKLGKKNADIVLQYLIKLFVDKLKPFEQDPKNEKLRKKLQRYANNVLNLLTCFEKEHEECPEIVKKVINVHSRKAESKTVTVKDMFRSLKTDVTLAVSILSHSDLNINDYRSIFNTTLRKLKVYFHNDIAKEYIKFFDCVIQEPAVGYNSRSRINSAIYAIFQLGDASYKISFMEKYRPLQPKIDHSVIDRKLLNIQEAICRYVGYSRPPVPLENVLEYIKGDYVHYCIPIFNMYLVNLPLPLVMKFTESLLDAPLSVQKHGLRLAFQCYDSEKLKDLVINTWKKSKNVSVRMIIYKALFDKLREVTNSEDGKEKARILYEALKIFTSDFHQDDHEDLFDLISSCGHRQLSTFIDDYLQTAWHMVIKLPKKSVNIDRKIKIINCINNNISLVQREFIRKNIIDEYIQEILESRRLRSDETYNFQRLLESKLNLIASYIVQYNDNKELEESLEFVSQTFKKCVEMWHDKYEETYVFQTFYFNFLKYIDNKILTIWYENPRDSRCVPILKHILNMLQEAFPLKDIYLIVWNLKLTIFLGVSLSMTNTTSCGDGESKPLSREQILSDNIANHIEQFIQDLLSKQQFYPVYLSKISWLIKNKLEYNVLEMKNLDIICSQSLANIGLKETHLLALMILPTDVPEDMKEIHARVLKSIQAFENDEIQSYLHFKFLSSYNSMFSVG